MADTESAGAELSNTQIIVLRGATAFQSLRKCLTQLQTSHLKKLILAQGQL